MTLWPLRVFLYTWVFVSSVILLGLTGYRIHYTKGLDNGDILTSSTHFYDPIIVELLVTSALAIIFSLWLLMAALAKVGRSPLSSFGAEHVMLLIIWIMMLVGAAITTHNWSNLKWCRGSHKECRILETIKAFSWITWGFITFCILASIVDLLMGKHGPGDTFHRRGATGTSYPETRQPQTSQTTTTTTTHPRTVPANDTV